MTSTVTIYYLPYLIEERRFILESSGVSLIEQYLDTQIPLITITNFQWVRNALTLDIKVDLPQTYVAMGNMVRNKFNYLKVYSQVVGTYYYFITDIVQVSPFTLRLFLKMDTINRFMFNRDFGITNKTVVLREHEDRFEQDPYSASILKRKIPLRSEEINFPLYKTSEQTLYDENLDYPNIEWQLYYRNSDVQSPTSPVNCYLVPSMPITARFQSTQKRISVSDITLNNYLIFAPEYPNPPTIMVQTNPNESPNAYVPSRRDPSPTFPSIKDTCLAIKHVSTSSGDKLQFYIGTFIRSPGGISGKWEQIAEADTFELLNPPNTIECLKLTALPSYQSYWQTYHLASAVNHTINIGASQAFPIYDKTSIDKTLKSNIKLINLPYSPTPFSEDDNKYILDPRWKYDGEGRITLANFSETFDNTVHTSVRNPARQLFEILDYPSNYFDGTHERFLKDPKLYHSDYYRQKFVYDSFSKTFALETFEPLDYDNVDTNFSFKFIMSRNIISKFLFMFNFEYRYTTEDYPNALPIARNNDEALYSSQYLDYVRTGYNFDLKARQRELTYSIIQAGVGAIGNTLNVGRQFEGVNASFRAGGLIAGAINGAIGIAKNTAQGYENIERKLEESRVQAVSVLNADDFDLLYAYSGNKAKLCIYEVSDYHKKILDDVFFYNGYICAEQKIPDVNTRIHFNYLQANLDIINTQKIPDDILDDIRLKYSQGVTFLHPFNSTYDFLQEKENLETWLVR